MRSKTALVTLQRSRLLVLAVALMLVGSAVVAPAQALDDVGPTADVSEVTETPEATPTPTSTATATPTPTPTATPTPATSADASPTAQSSPTPAETGDDEPVSVQDDLTVSPQAAEDSTIRVFKGGIRRGLGLDQDATPLAGATFAAYRKGNSQNQNLVGGTPEATCVTDANGQCDLLVNSDSSRYLVVEQSAPDGWTTIDEIALGAFNASGTPRPYRWNVGVRAGEVTEVPRTEIRDSSNQSWPTRDNPDGPLGVDDYRWANVKDNVDLPVDKCGLSLALIFDQSGSIGSNQRFVQDAAKQFIDDLTGTPTSVALFTFSTNSPQNNGGSVNRPIPVPISDASGAAQVKGWIDGFSPAGGGTNWDHALRQVANAGQDYDLAIMLTDGNPTAWRGETASTDKVNDWDVEEAVHSANWVKDVGTRMVAIGFSGQAGGLNETNLELISGVQKGDPNNPQTSDDYFLTTFGELGDLLSAIALNNCGGTINVQKKIAPTWEGIENVPLEPLWPFEREASQDYVTPQAGTTGGNGSPLEFRVTFEKDQLFRDVTIVEPDLQSFTPIPDPDTGLNARCSITGVVDPTTRVVNVENGITIENVTDKEIVSCEFVNSPARLEAKKYQDFNANGTQDPGEPFLQGWDIFIDDNDNSQPDPGERLLTTDDQGAVLFTRLDAPAEYRVCEVLQDGWFNTDPGGGALCKTQQVELQGEGDPPAGPVLFGNVEAGGFTVTKQVADETDLVPDDTEYTVEVQCEFQGSPVAGYPQTLTLSDGESATVGPLIDGTTCDISETDAAGATVGIEPSSVTIPADDGVDVIVSNTFPAGVGEVVKVVDGPLADELAPPGTQFDVEVTCTYPVGFPGGTGDIPGFNPLELTIESGTPGNPGTPVEFGPLPLGSECTVVETDDRGAEPVTFEPPDATIVITDDTESARVTVTNTYNPAAVQVIKVVDPTGSVPSGTEFVARVQCSFPTTPPGQIDRDENVTFSVDKPGVVSGLPLNSTCEVTEVDTNGATAVVSPEGPFPVDADPVEVTITNTFGTGQLTVEKSVDDGGSGVVPDGTEFTIDVACVFGGSAVDGFPQSITLTDGQSQTFTDLPYGTECTVTETDDAGADSVVITPNQPVTIDEDTSDVSVSVSNVFDTDVFEVTKTVEDATGLVSAGTEYGVAVTCQYPDSYPATGPIPGFDPLNLTLTDGSTETVGPLPVGAECVIEETDDAGASSSQVDPSSITVGDGSVAALATVTNTFDAGQISLRKQVDDGRTNLIPSGTEYDVEVTCTYPAGFPGGPGTIDGFDPAAVTIQSGFLGLPGPAVELGPLPVGAECTVAEPDSQGASSVEFVPDQPVTVGGPDDDPVDVVVRNIYPNSFGQVVKVADGPLAGMLAPQGTDFLAEVRCTFPNDYPVQGPIPGFNPIELVIDSGDPGQPGSPAPFGPLPVGSQCTVSETDDGGATTVTIEPDPLVITEETDPPATVTVTNTFQPAGLMITKTVSGPAGPLVPTDLVYTALVTCTFPGQDDRIEEVDFTVDRPGVVSNLPVGAVCEVTEVETYGAEFSVDPAGPFPVVGPEPVSVDVDVTNTFAPGELTITKQLTGEGAQYIEDGSEFDLAVLCTLGGSTLVGYPVDVTLTAPDDLTETITGLPVGSECLVSEPDTNGADSVTFEPPGDEDGQSGMVTIPASGAGEAAILVSNNYPVGPAEIAKTADGPAAGTAAPEGTEFEVSVACEFPPDFPATGQIPGFDPLDLTIESGQPGQPGPAVPIGELPLGSECTVTETDDGGATSVDINPSPFTIVDADQTVAVSVTNTFDDGRLTVAKRLTGPGAGLVPPTTVFTASVVCTFNGNEVFNDTVDFGVDNPVTVPPEADPGLPVGAECTVEETTLNGADSVQYEPSDTVTITGDDGGVTVTAVNDYPAGFGAVQKAVDGPLGEELAPPGTEFAIAVTCEYPAGFPATGTIPGYDGLQLTILAGGEPVTFGPLPPGAECVVEETDDRGASEITYDPESNGLGLVVIEEGTQEQASLVTVTNTFLPAALQIVKELDGDGADLIPDGTVFTVRATCTFPDTPDRVEVLDIEVGKPGAVSNLPSGSVCTLEEINSQGASNVEFSENPVTVTGNEEVPTPVQVSVTNTFEAGELTLLKIIDGGAEGRVPDGTTFTIEVTCTFDGLPVEGFDPSVVQLTTPDLEGTLGPLPVGAECTADETENNGAQDVQVQPEGGVTIGAEEPVTIQVTNTFENGSLVITKELAGPGGELIPDGTTFEVSVVCEFLGDTYLDDTFELVTPAPVSIILPDLPIGSDCTISETDDQGAQQVVVDPEQVTITEEVSEVDVTVTNTFETGDLVLTKALRGTGAQFLPDGTVFTLEVACTFAGQPVTGFEALEVTLTTPDALTDTVGPLPIGAECTVTETEDQGAQQTTITPDQPVVITGDQEPVEVTVTNVFLAGELLVTKVVDGEGASFVPDGTVFTVDVTCTYLGQPVDGVNPLSVDLTVPDGLSQTVSPLPIGAQCSGVESVTNGAAMSTVTPDSVTIGGPDTEPVELTATNTYDVGDLVVTKVVDGDGADFLPDGTTFTVEASCTFLATDLPVQEVVLTTPDQLTGTITGLPLGADCTLEETVQNGASSVTIDPESVMITDATTPVEVTVTNTYDVGSLLIEKVITGSGAASATGPFEFELTCTFRGADLDPQPDTVSITPPATSVQVDGIPVGAECTVVELAPYGGADGPAVVEPGSVVVGSGEPVTVTATNTFTKPPEPPTTAPPMPPTTPQTGAGGLGPAMLGASLLVVAGAVMVAASRRGRGTVVDVT